MVGRRRSGGRGAGRRSVRSAAPSTPRAARDDSDEEMADDQIAEDTTELPLDQSEAPTPAADDEDRDGEASVQDDDEDASSPPEIETIPRRRGPGRPPRGPRTPMADDDASDSATPRDRRRRGAIRASAVYRGGSRGRSRWGKRTEPDRMPIDKAGNMVDVVDDSADLPEDVKGETKVDKNGNLLGDRDYRVRIFTIKGREQRLYMLSTEPARCTGFRDSYLFFNKHLSLHKIILNDDEKMDLIERDVMPHSYKGRSIGVVTARSVYREFGARIVISGKKVWDDYYETAARQRGDEEGDLADPNDRVPPAGEPYNKNQYVAWHGASQVYHTQPQSTVQVGAGKRIEGRKRINLTVGNWMFEHAREASKFNSSLAAKRKANLDGVYDAHTNLMLFPRIVQSTHARWDAVDSPTTTNITNSDSGVHSKDPHPFFAPVSEVVKRNFLIADTLYTSAPSGQSTIPGPDGDVFDLTPNGLSSVPTELLEELPADCRAEFEAALRREEEWKGRWKGEGNDGMRTGLRIGYAGFPV